ncbi:MAG: Tk-subtilisin [ANME-2 cluster archaeon]|nr:Tk-subtilisin [ANME-2 cluster archaeon]
MTVNQNGDGYVDGVLQQTHDGSDYTTFGYYFYQGTSMAAPHVSGVAALLISNGVTSPDDVREALQSTAEDKGAMGWDPEYGWGIVDAYAALQWSAESNKPPVAHYQSVTTDEDTSVSITLSATDVDGDSLMYSIVDIPSNGTVSLLDNTATYTPATNYNGADSFTFEANDGTVDSNTATVSITVTPATSTTMHMHVASIDMSLKTAGPNRNAIALVTIVDESDNPVEGATVSGHWSGVTGDSDSGLTGASGEVSLKSNKVKNVPSGTIFTFTVDDVSLAGWTYDPTVTSGSITAP